MDKRSRELLQKEEQVRELYEFIAEQVIAGLFKADIIEKVIELGYDKHTASDLVDEMERRMQRMRRKTILLLLPPSSKNQILVDEFSASGFKTQSAQDGRDFLKNIKPIVPDLVVLEHAPPDIDGLKLIRSLRRHPIGRQIPVFVLAQRRQMRDAFETLGQVEFISAPFKLDEIIQKAKNCLL